MRNNLNKSNLRIYIAIVFLICELHHFRFASDLFDLDRGTSCARTRNYRRYVGTATVHGTQTLSGFDMPAETTSLLNRTEAFRSCHW